MPQIDHSEELDWEVELAVVIGKECRNVTKEEALDYVFGYTVANDVSQRYWQKNAGASQVRMFHSLYCVLFCTCLHHIHTC